MTKVSNEVLLERLDSLHSKFDTFLEDDYKPLKNDVKYNTEFRQKAYGVISAIAVFWTVITSIIVWIAKKIWGN